MAGSQIFLIFPKGAEEAVQPSYIKTGAQIDDEKLKSVIDCIKIVKEVLESEIYMGFYDAINVKAFLYPIEAGQLRYPSMTTYFRSVLRAWGENWRKNAQQSDEKQYQYFNDPIQDDTLCEMTERIITATNGSSFMLINCEAINCKNNFIKTSCNRAETKIEVCDLSAKHIAEWFAANRKPQRKFQLNRKHGENGKGAFCSSRGEKVSKLMCDREKAEALLRRAIGEGDENNTLYFYDSQCEQYIEFKHEGNNVYHGYHLYKKDSNRVPTRIRELIRKLLH